MRRLLSLLLLGLITIGLPAQNILNNGGFETGLMCWAEWVLSSTLATGAGDYRFAVSTDTRPGSSGVNSLEIVCEGSDCYKGYIYTDQIPASANQTYQLSYWAKCPAGGTVYVSPPGVPLAPSAGDPEVYGYAVCNGSWNLNQLTFTSADPYFTPGYVRFALNAFNQTPWALFDDVTLTYGDGTAPQHVILHPGARNAYVSGQTVNVDGSPFLSLGFYDVGYNDLAQVAGTGANTINAVGSGYNATDCFNMGQKSYLDQAYELGLNFVPDSTTTARLANPASMASARATFAPHLANIAWTLADEPDLWAFLFFAVSNFPAEYAAAKGASSLPVTTNLQRASFAPVSDTSLYNGSVDIWMAEPYGPDFSSTSYAINLFNAIQPRPIWLAQDDIGSLIVPKAYFAVIGGVTGIHYFSWDTFKGDPVGLAAASQVFSELKGLNNAIFGQKMDALVTAPSGIAAMSRFDWGTGNAYILSVNSASQNIQGNFFVQGLAAGQPVTVLYENRTITANAGSFSDTFSGVSRHVYSVHAATTGMTASLISEAGATASRDWKIQVYNTGLGAANSAQISSVTLTETGGTACSPTIAPGTFPLALGNLAPSQSAVGDVIINFTGCDNTSKFTVKMIVSANSGATSATVVRNNERI